MKHNNIDKKGPAASGKKCAMDSLWNTLLRMIWIGVFVALVIWALHEMSISDENMHGNSSEFDARREETR